MKRRNALKMLGAIVVMYAGKATLSVRAKEPEMSFGDIPRVDDDIITIMERTKLNWIFYSEEIGNITIKVPDEPDIVFPFSDIIKALKEDKK